jgi:hypothetical protein
MEKDSNFEFYFQDQRSQWNTNTYRRYGIAAGPRSGSEVTIWSGSTWIGQKINNPKPGTWYNLLLAIGKGPKFLLVVWERDNGSILYVFNRTIPSWTNATWQLQINSFYGQVQFNNFADISFTGIK